MPNRRSPGVHRGDVAGGEGRDLGRDLHVKGPSEPYCCSASPNQCVCTVLPGSPCLCRAFASALASPEKCRSCLLGCAPGLSRTHWGLLPQPSCQEPTDTEVSLVQTDRRCWRSFSPLRTGAGPFPSLPSPPVSPGGTDTHPNSPQEAFHLADWYHHRDQHLDVVRQADPQCLRAQLHRLPPALPDVAGAQEVRRGLRGYLQVQLCSCWAVTLSTTAN